MMSRDWERGRLAHAAGKPRTANPHRPGARGWAAWLSGWLYQDERFPKFPCSYLDGPVCVRELKPGVPREGHRLTDHEEPH